MAKQQKNSVAKKDNFTRNLVIGMIALVAIVGVGFSIASNKTNNLASSPSIASKTDGYGITFNTSATPRIDLYEDFQCPICQAFESLNNSYINQLARSGKAKVVFHPMTFIGPESILAANMAACAADEGRFLEAHSALYANQPAHENSGTITNDYLILLGSSVGLTDNKFKTCVTNGNYVNWTKNIEADASSKNVNATPTVFVNGKEIDRKTQYMDSTAFKKALSDAGIHL